MNDAGLQWWLVNIGSGDGLVPSGNKPLPEPNVDPDLCRHMVSLGPNGLNDNKHTILFIQGDAFENAIYKIVGFNGSL